MKQLIRKKMTVALIVAAAAWVVYVGAFVHLYMLEGAIANERREVETLKRQQEQALALRSVKSDVRQNVQQLQDSVITKEARVDALEYIENVAETYSQQAVLQRVEEQPTGNPPVVKFTLAAQGSWRQMYTLLRKMETMRYVASIDQVELQKFSMLGTLSQTSERSGDVLPGGGPSNGFGSGWRLILQLSVLAEAAE